MATKAPRALLKDIDAFVSDLDAQFVRAPPTRGWSTATIESLRLAQIASVSRMCRHRRGPRLADSFNEF